MADQNQNSPPSGQKGKQRFTVLVDSPIADRLRKHVSLTPTHHTMSSVVTKAMRGAARYLETKYGPFPPSEGDIHLKGGRPPKLPGLRSKNGGTAKPGPKKVPITVYVEKTVSNHLKRAV